MDATDEAHDFGHFSWEYEAHAPWSRGCYPWIGRAIRFLFERHFRLDDVLASGAFYEDVGPDDLATGYAY